MARSDPSAARTRAAQLLHGLLRPGLQLMDSLRMRAKLGLVCASVTLPLLWLMLMSLGALAEQRRVAQAELQGAAVSELLTPVVAQAQVHRGLTYRVLSGDASAVAPRDASRAALKAAVAALDAALARRMSYPLADLWQPLRGRLLALAAGRHAAAAADAFEEHSAAVEALRQLALANGERSGLVLDPEPRSYFLMDVVVNSALPLAESAALARGLGSGLLARGDVSANERADVLGLAGLMLRGAADTAGKLAALERAGGEVPGSWPQAQADLHRFAKALRDDFGGPAVQGRADTYYDLGTLAVNQILAVQHDATTRLTGELLQRQRSIERTMTGEWAAFACGLLALGYLLACFSGSFSRAIESLRRGTEAIAEGNLAHVVKVRGRDELADIGRVVDAMSRRLSTLVSEIRNSAALVNLTGQQVSAGSGRLAIRTEEQASSLRSSIGAISELSGAVAHNAEAARRLDSLTGRLASQAEEGNAAMHETVQAMQQMQQASSRVTEIVAVIDDVAFQTGMLSLNASIEAARAGEAGKGFAVVAGEVRQLAQSCGDSADEIRRLIGDADGQVQAASGKLAHVSAALATIVGGVREVSMQLRSISASSTQQSAGLEDVTQAVGNLDEITRENAALVEESTTASSALVDRAGRLREAVASMRLRQGSADEALALVRRAAGHYAAVGRTQALADFHRAENGYADRDLYLFCLDRSGLYVAHAAQPDRVGQDAARVAGADPDLTRKLWLAADAGGGWVPYTMSNPATGLAMDKESYVVPVDGGLLLGCGIYRGDGGSDPLAAIPRARAWLASDEAVAEHQSG